jgi:hypothetical protein
MPVVKIAGRGVSEDDTVPWLELRDLHLDFVECDWPSAPA